MKIRPAKLTLSVIIMKKAYTRSERRRLAEANELSSNTLKGVKLHLLDRCKSTHVPKVYFLTPFPAVGCNNSISLMVVGF